MPEIKITITNKKAAVEGTPVIVCGNSDYVLKLTLDAEWAGHNTKTARFVYRSNGVNCFAEKVFTGTTCEVPVLYGVDFVLIGVYAGNLRTSSPAKVACSPCILDGNPVHQVTEDVYNQLITMFDTRLPADTAWHNATANALKGVASGEAVTVTDASPIVHEPSVWVHGTNIAQGATTSENSTQYVTCLYCECNLKPNTVYTLSFIGAQGHNIYFNEKLFVEGGFYALTGERQSFTVTTKADIDRESTAQYSSYGWLIAKNRTGNTVTPSFAKVQIELGDIATEYTPYLDPTGVKVTAAGVKFTPGADGSVVGISSDALAGGITTDTADVIIEVEYNRDVNKAIEQLTNAVIALGGKV